jgi:hypothetical protein
MAGMSLTFGNNQRAAATLMHLATRPAPTKCHHSWLAEQVRYISDCSAHADGDILPTPTAGGLERADKGSEGDHSAVCVPERSGRRRHG